LALFASAGNSFAGDVEDVVQSDAFDDRYRVSPERAERQPFFRNRYLADAASWRRIDRDWMAAGTSLALGLDGRCRNLSLAIAIEVEQGGPILLFPGDAQAESWAAWAKLRWHAADRGERPVTGADLLARTILLKVGHHGAAGATPGPGGLDLMNSPELVAMLPVDEEFAENCCFRMPDPSLVERLLRTTRGRLLRSDRPFPERPEEAALGEWEAFRESVFVDPDDLYIDLLLRS
jgi:hypothetical protein